MTPARSNDEQQTADRESNSRNDRPYGTQLEPRNLCRGQPDTSEQNEQEANLGQTPARLMRQRQDEVHSRHYCPMLAAVPTMTVLALSGCSGAGRNKDRACGA